MAVGAAILVMAAALGVLAYASRQHADPQYSPSPFAVRAMADKAEIEKDRYGFYPPWKLYAVAVLLVATPAAHWLLRRHDAKVLKAILSFAIALLVSAAGCLVAQTFFWLKFFSFETGEFRWYVWHEMLPAPLRRATLEQFPQFLILAAIAAVISWARSVRVENSIVRPE